MEQGCDGQILVAAGFKDKRRDGHQMRDVGDWRAFAALGVMQTGGKLKGEVKTPCQKRLAPGRHGWTLPSGRRGNDTSNSPLYLFLNFSLSFPYPVSISYI